ncbi:Cell growth-regulating nucleolar protein [Madurella mycetomatis]|uniref:Cell growth-regulating nucleolar protein n=1 Tax=Madurella mycetomatis TaxID=100816 RepID=A0A175WEI6_9PEZI|nr:Cell growth-regulating nucleolar protein [Madurella mycetomatis]
MVSFSCEACGDVLTKKKLDPHRNRCRGATFTCIDCMVHFPGTEYRMHTSCMSEAQKYQGALYREKIYHERKSKPAPSANSQEAPDVMAHAAYVEDVAEDYDSWRDYEQRSDDDTNSVNPPPEAPTPPSAVEPVNVFDFLVANQTPTASNVSLPATAPIQHSEETALVRFDPEANDLPDTFDDDNAMVQYGSGPVPMSHLETPAPKAARRKVKDGDKETKKDKKRKRLHIETDHIMTDAPPVLHSGLTGGMNRLMARPTVFPPSPDYSGGDAAETPASPLKKTKSKHHKSSRTESFSNSLMAMIAAGAGAKPKPSSSKKRTKTKPGSSASKKKKRGTTTTKAIEGPKDQKLLEYRPGSKDGEDAAPTGREMVVYKPRAEHFLSFVTKGPESRRGYSVNKALKRYHRERDASGVSLSRLMEEKELWRSLRMKKNDRGEIVLFCL